MKFVILVLKIRIIIYLPIIIAFISIIYLGPLFIIIGILKQTGPDLIDLFVVYVNWISILLFWLCTNLPILWFVKFIPKLFNIFKSIL